MSAKINLKISARPKETTIRFRAVNRDIFLAIKNGTKKIETRAATKKYQKIQKGDTLVFVCGEGKFKKQIKNTEHFPSVKSLVKKHKPNAINSNAHSEKELSEMYDKFPGYKEKIKEFGIVVWKLE